jgi:hypothetical protein
MKIFLLVLISTGAAIPAAGQEFTRAEIGVNTSVLYSNRLLTSTDHGIGGRFTYNFTPNLAIDSEFDSYFTNLNERSTQDGGRASVLLAGVKAGIRRSNFGFFFKARPGIISFGDVPTSEAIIFGGLQTTRKTHAALDVGVTGEFYPSPRIILRLDISQMLVRYGDIVFPNGSGVGAIGQIGGPLHVEAGASYRVGRIMHDYEGSPLPSRFYAGAQYSLFSSDRGLDTVRDESGVGGWFTWNFSKYFAFDSSATWFPRLVHIVDFQQGGRMFQALAGIRGGIRRERFGVFAKFRPGIQLYTNTEGNATKFVFSPFTDIAFDSGGIIEVYTTERTMLRFDAGNTSIYYRPRDVFGQNRTFHIPGFTNNTIQLSTGFGFRF